MKTVRSAFDATVNDVALALCSGAIRRYLVERDELPSRSLTVANPVNLRDETERGQYENRVKIMGPLLETQHDDPAERLRAIVRSTRDTKRASASAGTNLFEDLFGIMMPGVVDQIMSIYTASGLAGAIPAPYNTVMTNLHGPPVPVYFAGARFEALYIQMPLFDGVGLITALMSYAGRLFFSLTATHELTPDVWKVAEGIEEEMDLLLDAGRGAAACIAASKLMRQGLWGRGSRADRNGQPRANQLVGVSQVVLDHRGDTVDGVDIEVLVEGAGFELPPVGQIETGTDAGQLIEGEVGVDFQAVRLHHVPGAVRSREHRHLPTCIEAEHGVTRHRGLGVGQPVVHIHRDRRRQAHLDAPEVMDGSGSRASSRDGVEHPVAGTVGHGHRRTEVSRGVLQVDHFERFLGTVVERHRVPHIGHDGSVTLLVVS